MDGGDAADNTIINQIMLKFRPIAPKPTGRSFGKSSPESGSGFVGVGRRKRRYVRVSGTTTKRSGESSKGGTRSEESDIKTLRLMPDGTGDGVNEERRPEPLDLETGDEIGRSWVKVVSLTKACMMEEEGAGLGSTDEERWRNLEGDTCPGFISDGWNKVVWSNAAFRRMVVEGGEGHVEVNLEVEERVRVEERCRAFSCMVRMKYTWQRGRSMKTVVVPCDVWRMSNAGFAWRIDLKAALSLSLVL